MVDSGDLATNIIQKATRDPEFRTKLITDTRAAVESVLGMPLPESFNVNVIEAKRVTEHLIEAKRNKYYLVLPATADDEGDTTELPFWGDKDNPRPADDRW